MISVHVGLDIGGTATRWVACADDGSVLARGDAPGATGHVFNPAEQDRLRASLAAVAGGVGAAGYAVAGLTAGITGYGAPVADQLRALAVEVLGVPGANVLLTDDILLAYMAHFAPGEGHLVSAGTGSIGVHVAAGGEMVRVGGRGIMIDDAGSGSWIALRALDTIYRAFDHAGAFGATADLAEALFARIGGSSWDDVRRFVYGGDRGRIGTLAVAVADAANRGNAAALEILRSAGTELALLAEALEARAGPAPIRFVGGVLGLHEAILAEIGHCLPGRDLGQSGQDAALVAARLQLGGQSAWRTILARP